MKERRRNCADRKRTNLTLEKIHRNRRADPAMSMMIKLLGLASLVLRMLPPMPEIVFAPRLHPVPEPPPPPSAIPEPVVRRAYKTSPSWPMLFRDLRRPVAHDEALEHVRARLPSSVTAWLDYVDKESEWGLLQPFAISGATDETVTIGVVAAAKAWQDAKDAKEKKLKTKRDGIRGAGSAAAPGSGDADEDEDEDTAMPSGPK